MEGWKDEKDGGSNKSDGDRVYCIVETTTHSAHHKRRLRVLDIPPLVEHLDQAGTGISRRRRN